MENWHKEKLAWSAKPLDTSYGLGVFGETQGEVVMNVLKRGYYEKLLLAASVGGSEAKENLILYTRIRASIIGEIHHRFERRYSGMYE